MPTDSTETLQNAIHKLEVFSRQAHKERLETPLKKAISLFKSMIAETFSNKTSSKNAPLNSQENPADILQAVEVVNRGRFLIQKLKSGNSTERSLASSFAKSIENYNRIRDCYHDKSKGQKRLLFHSLFKKNQEASNFHLPKIDLLQPSTAKYHFTGSVAQKGTSSAEQEEAKKFPINPLSPFVDFNALAASEKHPNAECSKEKIHSLALTPISLASSLPQQSAELFQMKALTLLERYGIASNPEARTQIKQSPIFTTCMPGSPQCTLSQTLELFPGQTIVVKGSSELDPTTQTIRKLFPETFSILLESSQTGFPHPSQRAGWTLANELLPHYPQRIDLLPSLGAFYQAKLQAATDLLPKGSRIANAKKLLKLKRQVFNKHKTEMTILHHQLSHAIARAAFANSILATSVIDAFFDELSCQSSPYDTLAESSQCIQDLFIADPYRYLLKTALEDARPAQENYSLLQNSLKKSLHEAQAKVRKYSENATSISERRKWAFVELMGTAFGPSSQNIMLQYLSEDLVFRPPLLDNFARKAQSAAYRHVEDFLQELYNDPPLAAQDEHNFVYNRLREQTAWDIALFQGEYQHPAVQELAEYFDRRYNQFKT